MKSFFLVLTLTLILFGSCTASTPIILSDSNDIVDVRGAYIDYFVDTTGRLEIQDIASSSFIRHFTTGKRADVIVTDNFKANYWVKIKVVNKALKDWQWVAELYDFRIEDVSAYIENGEGIKMISVGGANYPFHTKHYKHKNFIFNLHLLNGDSLNLYYKIHSDQQVSLTGRIRTYERLLEYSNTEYFMLALFYGVVVAMILYNFFLFLALFDFNYLFYVLYVLSIGIYAFNNDGLGFQYLWPEYPEWNDYNLPISNFSMSIWALMYGKSFLSSSLKSHKAISNGFIVMIGLKTIYFIASFYYPSIANITWIDVLPFVYIYIAGIISLVSGNRMARYYVLAFTLFFTGFVFSILRHFQLITDNVLTVYSFNLGVLCEMILLSFALADRIKMMTYEKEKELENTVLFRTQELEHKNKELDTFVYRSSHDIKGPIKSIIGLAALGEMENESDSTKEYFKKILKSSKKLDDVVDHLLSVIEIKESKLAHVEINFNHLISSVKKKFEKFPAFKKIDLILNLQTQHKFLSDEKLLLLVFENLVNNCIKHVDLAKPISTINIQVKTGVKYATVVISDNGIGLDEAYKEKIFDMLYSFNETTSDGSVGLYMTKLYIDKLEGSMSLHSEKQVGSTFHLSFKNQYIPNEPSTNSIGLKNIL